MGIAINDSVIIPSSQSTDLRVDRGGLIKSIDYYSAVSAGIVQDSAFVAALGNNPTVDTGTVPEDIWSGGGQFPWITAAAALEAVSSSANDAAAGTGVRTMTVVGLDSDYSLISEVVTLNGTTPVALANQFFRINQVQATTAGSGRVNAGDISIRDVSGATVRAIMPASFGLSRSSNYTPPAGYTLLITNYIMCINRPSTQRDATMVARFRSSTGGVSYNTSEVSVDGNPFQRLQAPPVPVSEKTDFIFRCTYVSANTTDITAGFTGILRKNG